MVRTVQTLLAAALLSACSSTPVVPAPYPPRYDAPYPPQYDVHSPYAFEYAVRDRYTGAAFSQAEQSSAAAVRGSYSVALPDGRIQHVTYVADHTGDGGYNAHVTYEGAAHHPAPLYGYQAPYQPQPAPYQPQSAPYQPQPAPYQPVPEIYQPEPEVYQPEPEVYQPEPEVYQAEPESYQLPLEPHKP